MHGYPSGTPARPSTETSVEIAALVTSSSISTCSRGNVVASVTVPFKKPSKRAAPVKSEVRLSILSFQTHLLTYFISLAGRSLR